MSSGSRRKLAIHGVMAQIDCSVPWLDPSLDCFLSHFEAATLGRGVAFNSGLIQPYGDDVVARLPTDTRHLTRLNDATDIYERDGIFWAIDQRWGMVEIDASRRAFNAWILPQPGMDGIRVVEAAVLWPLSQLLHRDGISLVPAVSAVRDGFAVLMLCPVGIEPELTAMIASGYRIIGQRWTAIAQDDGRVALLHMPGRIARAMSPRPRPADDLDSWLDLAEQYPGSRQSHAFCDAVAIVEPGRHHKAHLRQSDRSHARQMLGHHWPISQLHSGPRHSVLIDLLAEQCPVFEIQLSRSANELLALLQSMRSNEMPTLRKAAA